MKKRVVLAAFATVFAVLVSAVFATAQDFRKTYSLPSGGKVSIKNVSGDVKVTGYNIGNIEVVATKSGRDKDLVQVEDLSSGDRIELRVKYPESCNCEASINFDVRVPAGVDYDYNSLASVSGHVQVTGVRGRISAKSVSGDVTVRDVTGVVNAASVSGDVDAQITRFEGAGEMKFASVSGDVNVKAPGNPDAEISMASLSGTLDTDFPLEIQQSGHGPGRSAHGRIGAATKTIKLSTVSGSVRLTRS